MKREDIIQLCEQEALDTAARMFGTSKDQLGKFDDYEGCANLVYQFKHGDQPRVLRISYRADRPVELIQAELHFVNYLADSGMRVSKPLPSKNGHLVEAISTTEIPFIAARGIGLANFILNDPNPAWSNQAGVFVERVEKRLRGLMERNGIL